MSPYTIKVGREEIRFMRRYDAAKAMIAEIREQATYRHPYSVELYHYGELIVAW
jgi:hypothetical protein